MKNKIYWCDNCKIPISLSEEAIPKICTLCSADLKYLSSDIRPVFPEERLLIEIIIAEPFEFIEKSVWCNNSMYFIDGKKYTVSSNMWEKLDTTIIRKQLDLLNFKNTYIHFDDYIKKFILANKDYFHEIQFEAMSFIRNVFFEYADMPKYISFSGGKDSTVISNLVVKSISNPRIPHICCDTTLEYPYTLEYIKKIKRFNPHMIFKIVRNKEHDFYLLCDDIGIPSSPKRWCCTIFKTGVISKKLRELFGDKKLIYFNGIRRSESKLRSKYLRLSSSNDQKIQNQISVSPIIEWTECDVWIYILSEKIDFNYAYRLGFSRVGCYCCPNSSLRNETLCQIYMQDKANKWINYLFKFANKIGAKNPNEYVCKGLWKSKQGGKGIKSYGEISLTNKVCTIDENSVSYNLGKNINEEFYTLFIPFGKICHNLGRKILNETLVGLQRADYLFTTFLKTNVVCFQLSREKTVKIMMTNEQFEREKSYSASIHIMNIILKNGLINKKEYNKMCGLVNKKYRPILGDILL